MHLFLYGLYACMFIATLILAFLPKQERPKEIVDRVFERQAKKFVGNNPLVPLRNICTWIHINKEAENYSALTCNRCDYEEKFSPGFWDGSNFNMEGMSDAVYLHFMEMHQDIMDMLIELKDSMPGSRLVFVGMKLDNIQKK